MKNYLKRLWTSQRFMASVTTGLVAALAAADIVPDWATLIAIAAFAPVTDVVAPKARREPPPQS